MKPSNLGFITDSPLFRSRTLKAPDQYLTSADLQEQYGYMDEALERATRNQSRIMGRPLTRAEQRNLQRGMGEMPTESKVITYALVAFLAYMIYVVYNVDTRKKTYSF